MSALSTIQPGSMKVVYTAEALGDVANILSFIAERSLVHVPGVAARIDMVVKALAIFPRAARYEQDTNTYERPIPGLPVLLIYMVSGEFVGIPPAKAALRGGT